MVGAEGCATPRRRLVTSTVGGLFCGCWAIADRAVNARANAAEDNTTTPAGANRCVMDASGALGCGALACRPGGSVRQVMPDAQSGLLHRCANPLRHRVIEKPDPCGSGSSSSAREPTITFQRGTLPAPRS